MSTTSQSSREVFENQASRGELDVAEVEKLYNQLEPVTIEATLGKRGGGSIDARHPGHVQMLAMKSAGKKFFSADNVQPIIAYDAAGKRRYAEELSGGLARLREVKSRGVVSAAMIYNTQPVIDHFRLVDANTVAGAMDTRLMPEGGTYYFYLKRL